MKIHSKAVASATLIFIAFMIRLNASKPIGFTIDLIHRDSPESPSYNSSLTISERLESALQRSLYRVKILLRNYYPQSPSPNILLLDQEYVVRFFHGRPPVDSIGDVDTGSDLIWVQCSPCDPCYKQMLPFFNPMHSSTHEPLLYDSQICKSIQGTLYNKIKGSCGYRVSYEDGSFSKGEFATEIINLDSTTGQTMSFYVAMGCGYANYAPYKVLASGTIGMGLGEQSLITQLGPSIKGKFSYCLQLDVYQRSKLNFGDNAAVLGDDTVTTPVIVRDGQSYYFLILEGISVGNVRLEYYSHSTNSTSTLSNASKEEEEGNMIIDSGATATYLPTQLYEQVRKVVEGRLTGKRKRHPRGTLDLCYADKYGVDKVSMTFHFKGANLKLHSFNFFRQVRPGLYCLYFRDSESSVGVYGSAAQANFLVGYDLHEKTVSFKPTNCNNE